MTSRSGAVSFLEKENCFQKRPKYVIKIVFLKAQVGSLEKNGWRKNMFDARLLPQVRPAYLSSTQEPIIHTRYTQTL